VLIRQISITDHPVLIRKKCQPKVATTVHSPVIIEHVQASPGTTFDTPVIPRDLPEIHDTQK
jgi:hypothetical protein